uniref:Selenoprotein I n=1 Tax=Crocodylus porosus TaxID=8502 RepID=A0A7M4FA61_CROPO
MASYVFKDYKIVGYKNIVPQWVAPNLLTFSGFVMLLINYFLLSFYDWDYTASGTSPGSIPTWVWLFSAFATFCAYTLDSIDGKHARRTQCSTPLGELFDHGLDSWATSIFIFNFFSLCSRGNEQTGFLLHKMFLSLSIGLLNFMISHWEKYNTGVLFLPWGYDISQVFRNFPTKHHFSPQNKMFYRNLFVLMSYHRIIGSSDRNLPVFLPTQLNYMFSQSVLPDHPNRPVLGTQGFQGPELLGSPTP